MLGEKLGDTTGKIVSASAAFQAAGSTRMETTQTGTGTLLGYRESRDI